MANTYYDSFKPKLGRGEINLEGDNIKVCILGSGYIGGDTAKTTHASFADISAAVLNGTVAVKTLTNASVSFGGVPGNFGADDVLLEAIDAGQTLDYIVFFKDPDGTNIDGPPDPANYATSPLIAMIDSGLGLGGNATGADVNIAWPGTIFEL